MRFTYRTLIGKEKPPLPVLFKSYPILLTIRLTASSRIQKMMTHVLEKIRISILMVFASVMRTSSSACSSRVKTNAPSRLNT